MRHPLTASLTSGRRLRVEGTHTYNTILSRCHVSSFREPDALYYIGLTMVMMMSCNLSFFRSSLSCFINRLSPFISSSSSYSLFHVVLPDHGIHQWDCFSIVSCQRWSVEQRHSFDPVSLWPFLFLDCYYVWLCYTIRITMLMTLMMYLTWNSLTVHFLVWRLDVTCMSHPMVVGLICGRFRPFSFVFLSWVVA